MKYVLRIYESKADTYGNRYFFAKLIHVKTGESVVWDTASDGNARSELQKALGLDRWDDYEKFRVAVWIEPNQIVGYRELRQREKLAEKYDEYFYDCEKAVKHLKQLVKKNLTNKKKGE